MTATAPAPNTCPNCRGVYSFAQQDGTMFCPECRQQWKLGQVPAPEPAPTAGPGGTDSPSDPPEEGILGPAYSTIVNVTYRTETDPEPRTDRYTYITPHPHTAAEAIDAGELFFMGHDNVHLLGSTVFFSDPPIVGVPTMADAIGAPAEPTPSPDGAMRSGDPGHRQNARAVDWDPIAAMAEGEADLAVAQIEAAEDLRSEEEIAADYLASLVGTGVTLEGGQRGTILEILDSDAVTVQLGDGRVETVDFGDIVAHDNVAPAVEVDVPDIDDHTAALFGETTLIFACMAVEAGVASLEGDGPDYRLIEPPSGWMPDDDLVLPMLEQAAALGVAMLIQAFGLDRSMIATAVEQTRSGLSARTTTEGD